MKEILAQVPVEITPANKKAIDAILHDIVGVPYKACPSAWKAIKTHIKGSETARADFVARLRNRVAELGAASR
ncbi:MAG: hypothetical protein P8010_02615 [Desulfosarcinaceae bacterium]|jgi:hypothetical protein